jgi:hypothetical protein
MLSVMSQPGNFCTTTLGKNYAVALGGSLAEREN